MNMDIKISSDAADYIKRVSDTASVMIFMKIIQGGWCSYNVPSVEIGKPGNLDNFTLEEIDGVNLYVEKTIKIHPSGAEINLLKGIFRKGLRVVGVLQV